MPALLLDTGPIVAYFYPRDAYHEWAVERFSAFDPPFVTCEAVVAEACFLLARNRLSPARVLEAIERDVIRIDFQLAAEVTPLRDAMERYANVPMSLADACLVRLAELTGLPICTLDSDFTIYRSHRRRPLELIAPARFNTLHEP